MGYIIIELAGQISGDGITCTEVEADNYTLSVMDDLGVSGFSTSYWNREIWDKTRLVDKDITYSSGGTTTAFFGGTAGWGTDKYVRFALSCPSIPIEIRVYAGSPQNRIPQEISAYYCSSYTSANLSDRSNDGLILYGTYTLDSSYTSVAKLVFLSEPVEFGLAVLTDDISDSKRAHVYLGANTGEVLASSKNVRNRIGLDSSEIVLGSRLKKNSTGLNTDINLISFGKRYRCRSGYKIEPTSPGGRARNCQGIQVDELEMGPRLTVTFDGISLEPEVKFSSNAEYRYKLLVTPTHQYRSQIVTISATSLSNSPTIGRYKFEINKEEIIPYESADADLSDITFNVTAGQLITGINYCKITYLYPNNSTEYLEFEIFKEETKRTTVERLFRYYDGGYDGNKMSPSSIYLPYHYPSITPLEGSTQTLIKTTDYTDIPLQKYTAVQGVTVDASGALFLVSFDKGTTWKSFISNAWQTVDIANIAAYGMTDDTLNAITMVQWGDIFTPTQLDFAILLQNSLSAVTSTLDTCFEVLASGVLYHTGSQSVTLSYTASSFSKPVREIQGYYIMVGMTGGTRQMTIVTSKGTTTYGEFYGNNNMSWADPFKYILADDETFTSIVLTAFRWSNSAYYDSPYKILGVDKIAYLKSINVQITPRLKMGYAFIM